MFGFDNDKPAEPVQRTRKKLGKDNPFFVHFWVSRSPHLEVTEVESNCINTKAAQTLKQKHTQNGKRGKKDELLIHRDHS
jgi:hypothetical protein